MAIHESELRRVMGHFATGVTVVTTRGNNGAVHGLTANAITSVSMRPPLVLVCVDKAAESRLHLEASRVFTVNILSAEQEPISRRFALKGPHKFEGVSFSFGANGAPILDGALAFIECRLAATYEGGDHTIYIGEVEHGGTRKGRALVFFRGGYRELGD